MKALAFAFCIFVGFGVGFLLAGGLLPVPESEVTAGGMP